MIVVTRPGEAGALLCESIVAMGLSAWQFPTIAFSPPVDHTALEDAIKALPSQHWFIFVSPHAVHAALPYLHSLSIDWKNVASPKIAAVGEGTAHALRASGLPCHAVPVSEWNSEGLLALPEMANVLNQKIAIFRGEGGREKIDHLLAQRGATVLPVILYCRTVPTDSVDTLWSTIDAGVIDAWVAASFDAVRHLLLLAGTDRKSVVLSIPLLVVSERIAELSREIGFKTIWVAENASQQAVLDVLRCKLRVK